MFKLYLANKVAEFDEKASRQFKVVGKDGIYHKYLMQAAQFQAALITYSEMKAEESAKSFAQIHHLLPRDLRVDFENDHYNIIDDKERHINRFKTPEEVLAWCEGLLEDTVSTYNN